MKIAEIFKSFHGEINGHHQGRKCTFIRFSGCNLSCPYCDTAHTQDGNFGDDLSVDDIMHKVHKLGCSYVCLTGGEPLLNTENALAVLKALKDKNYKVSVETNGTIDIEPFKEYVESFVLDYKINLPTTGPQDNFKNFKSLTDKDVVKLLIGDFEDFRIATHFNSYLRSLYKDKEECPIVAFSPLLPKITPERLAKLITGASSCDVVLSVQMHKILNFK